VLAGVSSAASQLNAPRGFMWGYRAPADGDVTTSRRLGCRGASGQHPATVCSCVCLVRRRLRIEGGPLKGVHRVRHRFGGVLREDIRTWQSRLGPLPLRGFWDGWFGGRGRTVTPCWVPTTTTSATARPETATVSCGGREFIGVSLAVSSWAI